VVEGSDPRTRSEASSILKIKQGSVDVIGNRQMPSSMFLSSERRRFLEDHKTPQKRHGLVDESPAERLYADHGSGSGNVRWPRPPTTLPASPSSAGQISSPSSDVHSTVRTDNSKWSIYNGEEKGEQERVIDSRTAFECRTGTMRPGCLAGRRRPPGAFSRDPAPMAASAARQLCLHTQNRTLRLS